MTALPAWLNHIDFSELSENDQDALRSVVTQRHDLSDRELARWRVIAVQQGVDADAIAAAQATDETRLTFDQEKRAAKIEAGQRVLHSSFDDLERHLRRPT